MQSKSVSVLQLISSSATSGAERHTLSLSRELLKSGHKAQILCPTEGWLPDIAQDLHIPTSISPMRGRGWLTSIFKIRELHKTNPFDLIHCHLTRSTYIGYVAAKTLGIPVVASVHIANKDFIYKRLARGNNRLVAVSNYVKGLLHGRGIADAYIDTVYNGTDFAEYSFEGQSQFREEFSIPSNRQLIGLIGRVCEEKGHLQLVEALGSLRKQHPEAHLVFVGRVVDAFRPALEDAIESNELKERVTFTGIRNDVPAILDELALSTMPSHIETFGVAAIEAMARKRAVIASNVGGLPEVVHHSKTGILVDLRPESLAEAIDYMLTNERERIEMGKRGHEVVMRNFTNRVMASRFEQVYAKALSHA